jgi:uncharacterized membrane protein
LGCAAGNHDDEARLSSDILLFLAAFLASAVEAVEALTIVLAVGIVRGWRATAFGVGAAACVLAAIVAALGPALQHIPISTLRLVVGALLLTFGLQWLRKAVLRAAGIRALHDEEAAFAEERRLAGDAAPAGAGRMDWYAFTVAFKGVLLEGLEVAFIVLGFAGSHTLSVAVGGATSAVVLVVIVGLIVRGPLARVPENSLKFVVGVLLTTFGIFWAGEGVGVSWPGEDLALLVIAAFMASLSIGLVRAVRRGTAGDAIKAAA